MVGRSMVLLFKVVLGFCESSSHVTSCLPGNIVDVFWIRSCLLCNLLQADGPGNVANSSHFSLTKSIWHVMVKISNQHDSF